MWELTDFIDWLIDVGYRNWQIKDDLLILEV